MDLHLFGTYEHDDGMRRRHGIPTLDGDVPERGDDESSFGDAIDQLAAPTKRASSGSTGLA